MNKYKVYPLKRRLCGCTIRVEESKDRDEASRDPGLNDIPFRQSHDVRGWGEWILSSAD